MNPERAQGTEHRELHPDKVRRGFALLSATHVACADDRARRNGKRGGILPGGDIRGRLATSRRGIGPALQRMSFCLLAGLLLG